MNFLIADSGSTKTDWRYVSGTENISVHTQGYNPYHVTKDKMEESLRADILPRLEGKRVGQLFFYGSGCNEKMSPQVKESLRKFFPDADVEVHSDMLGAARGLCGNEKGMAAILGTGSNCCVYDGKEITATSPSPGYILGDEGSGAVLGKKLLALFLYGEMNEQLEKNFRARFPVSREEILENVYRKPFPNRYLASFAKFIYQNTENPQCVSLVAENFREFFTHHVLKFPGHGTMPLHVTGSVGFYFSNILRRVAEEKNIRIGRITESPLAGLVNFHSGETE